MDGRWALLGSGEGKSSARFALAGVSDRLGWVGGEVDAAW